MAAKARPIARPDKFRVLLVDDHPIMREGFVHLINHEPDLLVCGEAGTVGRALEAMAALKPDLMIVDISLGGASGLELIKDIHARQPRQPILALSMHDESLYAERALRAGARGYVMKQAPTATVMQAIRDVLRGAVYVSEQIRGHMLGKVVAGANRAAASDLECLSDRELEVFQLIGRGRRTRQIAEQLHLSVKTVETHRAHIKEKLGLPDGVALARLAVQCVERQH